jgi:hypothetical protein
MEEKVRDGQANFREAARNLGEDGDDCGNGRFGDSPLVFFLAALNDPADCVRCQVKEGKPQNKYEEDDRDESHAYFRLCLLPGRFGRGVALVRIIPEKVNGHK